MKVASRDVETIFSFSSKSMEFSKSYSLLSKNEWIHNFQVTDIIKKDVLHKMPSHWYLALGQLSVDELNEVPFLGGNSRLKYPEWPACLHDFLQESSQLASLRNNEVPLGVTQGNPIEISADMARGMKKKKLHEVTRMASLVSDIATEANCNVIIDVGSGLGYLDHVLHQKYGLRVLGMETVESHASAAERRAVKQGITCNGIKTVQCHIEDTEDSLEAFVTNVNSIFPTLNCECAQRLADDRGNSSKTHKVEEVNRPRICLIGLHCCGDLSTSMMSYFSSHENIKAICCLCCCYHKMAYSNQKFEKFPLSELGKRVCAQQTDEHGQPFITPYTLRLGAQETRCRWRQQTKEDHESHTRHVAFRGLLCHTDEDEGHIRQTVRHCSFESIQRFIDSYYGLPSEDPFVAEKRSHLLALHEKYKKDYGAIEILTLLQVILQPVIETLIYQDRAQWLKEQGHNNVKVMPVFDEVISPRNLALVAIK